ncbi:MAG: hypothetical protein GF419_02105 [Ignavibacteriales bacterium]|nr:hypothetical protein [Ignavibacteriales bacterium]
MFAFLALSAVIPPIIAFGTANQMAINALYGVPFWAVGFYAALVAFRNQGKRDDKERKTLQRPLITLVIVYTFAVLFLPDIYGTQPRLIADWRGVEGLENGDGLQFPPQTAEFIDATSKILQDAEFEASDEIISLTRNMSGALYFLGARSSMGIFYNPNKVAPNLYALRANPPKGERIYLLRRTSEPIPGIVKEALREEGVDYPAEFATVGKVAFPLIEADTLYIYRRVR